MRVSLAWLKEFVAVDVTVEKLAHLLDFSGLKVEAITRLGGSIEDVVVAEVLDITQHPDADNLILVEVRADGDDSQRVVCGARNFAVGDRVPLAGVGARLPGMEITERKIRGEVSRGMLCSAAELGISKDHSGILVLPPDSSLGQDVVSLLNLDDTVIELEVTPNRPDCMGIIGVAREVAALLGTDLTIPPVNLATSSEVASPVQVDVADPEGCPRYVARYLDGVTVRPSPAIVAARLVTAGVRPISNVVDATNYVMLETGQPLHPFDAAKVHEQHVVVRRARRGERLRTLDGVERVLDPRDLLIADPKRALGIAGVMGGEESEVSPETTSIILESAYFDPVSIALTARRHVLRSEASARFSSGVDPELLPFAAARAASLMVEHAGGRVARDEVDEYPAPVERARVTLRPRRSDALLGFEVTPASQVSLLRSVGFAVEQRDGVIEVEVPGWRLHDVRREADLVEEVARLAGYERLPSTLPPGQPGALDDAQRAERALRRRLVSLGLYEAWTTSFMPERDVDALGVAPDTAARRWVEIANPRNEDERALRTTLLPGLLRSAAGNLAQHVGGAALFELARVYEPGEDLPQEALVLGAVFAGNKGVQGWWSAPRPWDFFAAKGVLEATFGSLGWGELRFAPVTGLPFHPTRAASVSAFGVTLGALGELHPDVCARFDLPDGVVGCELALAAAFAHLPARAKAEPLPRFPAVYLDLAVVVGDDVPAKQVEDLIREAGAPALKDARLFDVYTGDQIAPGRKSLAFALELRDPDKTLTDRDAKAVRDRIVDALRDRFDAGLRS